MKYFTITPQEFLQGYCGTSHRGKDKYIIYKDNVYRARLKRHITADDWTIKAYDVIINDIKSKKRVEIPVEHIFDTPEEAVNRIKKELEQKIQQLKEKKKHISVIEMKKINKNNYVITYSPSVEESHIFMIEEILESDKSEKEKRIEVQEYIDKNNLSYKVDVMYDGNSIWSLKRIQDAVAKMKKRGIDAMDDYFYEFMHLCGGTIAHHNKQGWIATYPSLAAIRDEVIKGTSGRRILRHQPDWKGDTQRIAKWLMENF